MLQLIRSPRRILHIIAAQLALAPNTHDAWPLPLLARLLLSSFSDGFTLPPDDTSPTRPPLIPPTRHIGPFTTNVILAEPLERNPLESYRRGRSFNQFHARASRTQPLLLLECDSHLLSDWCKFALHHHVFGRSLIWFTESPPSAAANAITERRKQCQYTSPSLPRTFAMLFPNAAVFPPRTRWVPIGFPRQVSRKRVPTSAQGSHCHAIADARP